MTATAVLRAEWIKITTLRGTVWSLACVLVATAGFGILANASLSDAEPEGFDPLFSVLVGVGPGQIAAIVFGTLAVSSEYQSGLIRATLAAVPRRGLLYGAKLAHVGGLTLAVGLVTTLVSFLAGGAALGDRAPGLGDDGSLRGIVGGAVYLALMALLAAGLAAVLRSGVAVLGILIPFVLAVSMVFGGGSAGVADFLPDRAGQQVMYADPPTDLPPLAGLAVTALWAGAAVLAGWWTLRRRDA
ncbi:ABC transporter permease [Streptomyces sp. CMB-StM0423]|uniref:ABC transporter permease n=1 Tax=Streptomyces sp. CMB-StM0423 TaxID=2059884 RepID=UPI000C704D4C|nr:ABC transporter permease [Streptomyces sp. CMB-StM0423]AUH44473.1 ABC transporter permease [Streptomyces sp. CMB-StM0423]